MTAISALAFFLSLLSIIISVSACVHSIHLFEEILKYKDMLKDLEANYSKKNKSGISNIEEGKSYE